MVDDENENDTDYAGDMWTSSTYTDGFKDRVTVLQTEGHEREAQDFSCLNIEMSKGKPLSSLNSN